jgi:hypothetical protein
MATIGTSAQGMVTLQPWDETHAGLERGPYGRARRNATALRSHAHRINRVAAGDHGTE